MLRYLNGIKFLIWNRKWKEGYNYKVAYDLTKSYFNEMILMQSFGISRIYYEVYYLILRLISQPRKVIQNLVLTGSLDLSKSGSQRFVKSVFTESGGLKHNLNILEDDPLNVTEAVPYLGATSKGAVTLHSLTDAFPLHHLPQLEGMERLNGYLKTYRTKYSFINFVNSKLSGLILSRLYNGLWTMENITQDFSYNPRIFSLGWYLHSDRINIFNGTSHAVYELITLMSGRNPRMKHLSETKWSDGAFKPSGFEPPKSWNEDIDRILSRTYTFSQWSGFQSKPPLKIQNVLVEPITPLPPKSVINPLEVWLESWSRPRKRTRLET